MTDNKPFFPAKEESEFRFFFFLLSFAMFCSLFAVCASSFRLFLFFLFFIIIIRIAFSALLFSRFSLLAVEFTRLCFLLRCALGWFFFSLGKSSSPSYHHAV